MTDLYSTEIIVFISRMAALVYTNVHTTQIHVYKYYHIQYK